MSIDLQHIQMLIHEAQQENNHHFTPQQVIGFLDLTRLMEDNDVGAIEELCTKAQTVHGNVAAVCVYPQFITTAQHSLKQQTIKIATVVNFPRGDLDITSVIADIDHALTAGAEEIDAVIPIADVMNGDVESVRVFVQRCKQACGTTIPLKVILETGKLHTVEKIADASREAVLGGADFLKTSTGKIAVGATLDAAAIMLLASKNAGAHCGFKASGGVRTYRQACEYLALAELIMGKSWLTPQKFRIGASTLLDELLVSIKED